MQSGEDYGAETIVHFNGGLFDGQPALPLDEGDVGLLRAANTLDWGQIDPSIFGSLFERFLDPEKRAQIGAHYTDAEKIQKIIEPVILRPLKTQWDEVKSDIAALVAGKKQPPMRLKPKRRMKPLEAAEERRAQFLERLKEIQFSIRHAAREISFISRCRASKISSIRSISILNDEESETSVAVYRSGNSQRD